MKCVLIIISTIIALVYGDDEYGFVTKYIDMPLDHFSFVNNLTFKLKYLVNETYYSGGRPIFFYTGNEGDISMFAQNSGFMFDLAGKMEALIIFAEHRYYGESLPFGNDSYSGPEKLGYLSTQQALADFVYLIDHLQKHYATKSLEKLPVIAFGGSYGGMLAAWIRMKYPYSVLGAIATSAPIWQFKGLTNCSSFYEVTTNSMRTVGSDKCVETIGKSWNIFSNVSSTPQGKKIIYETFQLCQELTTDADVEQFLDWIEEIFVTIVEMNYPYPTSFVQALPGEPIKKFCEQTDSVNYTDDYGLMEALAKGLQVYTNYTGSTKCNDIGHATAPTLGETGWNFQSCTDMIMPMCSTDKDMFRNFEWDFQAVSQDCYEQFKVRPRSETVPILEYGGKDIGTFSNIVFSNGLIDPWSSGGVLVNVSSQVLAVIIPDGAHHFDLRGENPLDSEDVKNARKFHQRQINMWLDKYYFNHMSLDAYLQMMSYKFHD